MYITRREVQGCSVIPMLAFFGILNLQEELLSAKFSVFLQENIIVQRVTDSPSCVA